MLSVHQRYRRTDWQTDGRTTYDSNTAQALRASRGKNRLISDEVMKLWILVIHLLDRRVYDDNLSHQESRTSVS